MYWTHQAAPGDPSILETSGYPTSRPTLSVLGRHGVQGIAAYVLGLILGAVMRVAGCMKGRTAGHSTCSNRIRFWEPMV